MSRQRQSKKRYFNSLVFVLLFLLFKQKGILPHRRNNIRMYVRMYISLKSYTNPNKTRTSFDYLTYEKGRELWISAEKG